MKTIKLGELRKLYKAYACSEWREAILPYLTAHVSDSDIEKIAIADTDLERAKKEATEDQKDALIKLGLLVKDENVFVEQGDIQVAREAVKALSKMLFSNNFLSLSDDVTSSTTIKRPDLINRALYFSSEVELIQHVTPWGGTVLEIKKR